MGRGRGKGKKQTVTSKQEEPGSGEEERIPAYRRRGRPQKPLKDEIEEVETTEKIGENGENLNGNVSSNEMKTQLVPENKKKRKRSVQIKEKIDTTKEENGIRTNKSSSDVPTKTAGFRQNGSRRKNKPRRAAEAGVDCK
ncbi:uncharacterized protein LOC114734212 [Neltuma alba]|uniref:uncharacterized protein LOC114734212 n=1 Tax=Neltuma alba TaxID=207710 RepID=UPI0010A4CD4C|nr:uncharacterized protein LOC114734212 [Prosopis alba]XP_028777605.1 uncharacterized protein LOC114734212 [Prosopis alba]